LEDDRYFFEICNFSKYSSYTIARYNIEMGFIMTSKTAKNEREPIKMVRWDPVIARLEEYKLKN